MNSTDSPSGTASPSRWLPAGVLLAAALSAITGIVSYQHGLYVARLTGSTGAVAYLVPLVPDLMIATSSVTLIAAATVGRRPPTAMAALVAGIGWTVAQNIAGGWQGGTGGRLIAAGIPLALVVTFESLLWLLRNARRGISPGASAGPGSQERPPEPPTAAAAWKALREATSQRGLAELLDMPRSRIQAIDAKLAPVAEPEPSDGGRDGGPPFSVPAAPAALNGGGRHG